MSTSRGLKNLLQNPALCPLLEASFTWVKLDDQLFVNVGRQVGTLRQALEGTFHLSSVNLYQSRLLALTSNFQEALIRACFLAFANADHVLRGYLERRNIHNAAVYHDGFVAHQLTRFSTSGAEAHAVNDVVQTTFQQLQQVFTGVTLLTGSVAVVVAELFSNTP